MLTRKPFNKRKAFAVGVIFFGSFGLIKLLQDARYLKKDLHKLTEVQVCERDIEKVKERFKLTDREMSFILKSQKQRNIETINIIETDPNFEHKRAE